MTTPRTSSLDRLPLTLLRVEGIAVAVAAVALYAHGDHSWLLFALLILAGFGMAVLYIFAAAATFWILVIALAQSATHNPIGA